MNSFLAVLQDIPTCPRTISGSIVRSAGFVKSGAKLILSSDWKKGTWIRNFRI